MLNTNYWRMTSLKKKKEQQCQIITQNTSTEVISGPSKNYTLEKCFIFFDKFCTITHWREIQNRKNAVWIFQPEKTNIFFCGLLKDKFWRWESEDNCVLTVSFSYFLCSHLWGNKAQTAAGFHKKINTNDCFMKLVGGQLCDKNSQKLFHIFCVSV